MQISIELTKATRQYTLVSLMRTTQCRARRSSEEQARLMGSESGDMLVRGPWRGVGGHSTEWQFGLDWDAWSGQIVLLDAHCRPRRPVCHGHLHSTGRRRRQPTRQRHGGGLVLATLMLT